MTIDQSGCPHCTAPVAGADRFCESCGGQLVSAAKIHVVGVPRSDRAQQLPCRDCGNANYVDNYCTVCGARRAEPDRDQVLLRPVVLITDRGIEHDRNEDAGAAGILAPGDGRPDIIAVAVCDGVSTSGNSERASRVASEAGVSAMLAALGSSDDVRAAAFAGLADAAKAASAARSDGGMAPSCTYTAAIVVAGPDGTAEITTANVGDSRSYWIPQSPDDARQLTEDDSVAQSLMAAGFPPESEAVLRGAHTLTRWLGADSGALPWSDTSVNTVTVTGPGLLLVCSDGLWNYAPEAADIARRCVGSDATAKVRELVEFALGCGGHDNITVILVPIGGPT